MNNFNTYFIFAIVVIVLAFLLLFLNFILSPHEPYLAKTAPYECGFLSVIFQTRIAFALQSFMIALLFLLFDMELLFVFPLVPSFNKLTNYGYTTAMAFILILVIGFVLEIGSGAISLMNPSDKKETLILK